MGSTSSPLLSNLCYLSVIVLCLALSFSIFSSPSTHFPLPPSAQSNKGTPDTNVISTTTLRFGKVEFSEHRVYGSCLKTGGEVRHCERDEATLYESLVHPAIILHPFPRRILLAGAGTGDGGAVREVLKHFLLKRIVVVGYDADMADKSEKHLSDSYDYDDILSRVQTHPDPMSAYFAANSNERFDVIIVDFHSGNNAVPSPSEKDSFRDFIALAKSRLTNGGIVVTRTGEIQLDPQSIFWESHQELTRQFKHVHLFSEYIPSTTRLWGFHVMYDTDAVPDPRTLSIRYIDQQCDRKTTEDLEHYDGMTHIQMFNLPFWIRHHAAAHTFIDEKRAESPLSHAPHQDGRLSSLYRPVLRGSTLQREFFGCNPDILDDADEVVDILKEALQHAHASIRFIHVEKFETYTNLTGHDAVLLAKLVRENEANSAEKDESSAETDYAHLVAHGILDYGSVVLHIFPAYRYAVAVYTNFNFETVSSELLGTFFESFGSAFASGSTLPIGPPSNPPKLTDPGTFPDIDYHGYVPHYYTSPSFHVETSPTEGKGQFAHERIPKGTVLFQGPIDSYLLHDDEIGKKVVPAWLRTFISHMSENAEKDIWVAPLSRDQDASYYTNHNCDPNLVYDGYDSMIARRDIEIGEELTYDYSTVDINKDESFQCNCKSPNCRGKVSGQDWKNDEYVERLGLKSFWPHAQKRIILARREKEKARAK